MSLGQYLKRLRQQNGLTINEVVEQSEKLLDKTTVSRIERDERGVSLRAAYAFAKIYNVRMDEICEYVLGRKISPEHVPFETSSDERKLIRDYRCLSSARRKAVSEIVHGLAMATPFKSSSQARFQLERTLDEFEKENN